MTWGTTTLTNGSDGICAEIFWSNKGGSCASSGSRGMATIDVTQGQGGPAPFPAMVTSDYRRDLRVQLAPIPQAQVDPACPWQNAVLDVRFTETAADTLYDPNGDCGCI